MCTNILALDKLAHEDTRENRAHAVQERASERARVREGAREREGESEDARARALERQKASAREIERECERENERERERENENGNETETVRAGGVGGWEGGQARTYTARPHERKVEILKILLSMKCIIWIDESAIL
jgi:hypothetical protein